MSYITNMKVGNKLAVSSGLAVVLIAGMVVNQQMSSVAITNATTTVDNEQTILNGIVGSELSLIQMRAAANDILRRISPESTAAAVELLKKSSQTAWDGLDRPISIAKKPDILNEIRQKLRAFEASAVEIAGKTPSNLPAASAEDQAAAERLKKYAGEAKSAIEESVANARRFTDGARAELDRAVASATQIGLLAGLTVMLVLIGSAIVLIRSVALPIRRMTNVMRTLAAGDNQVEVPFVDQRDEIGEMAAAVETFKTSAADRLRLEGEAQSSRQQQGANLQRQRDLDHAKAEELRSFVQQVEIGFDALSSGDLSARMNLAVAPAFEPIRAKFNGSISQLERTIGSVVSSVGTMRVGLGQITAAAGDLSQRTEQQVASLEETVAALAEVVRGVNATAQSADHAKAAASVAQKEAEKGGSVVAQAVAAMAAIEQSSARIERIIGVIDEIAFQTNLLALNAGVEAARAGDAGKGFAVVAQEVRGLAQRSAEAAKEIKDLISTSSTQVEQGVKLVSASGQSLKQIVSQVEGVTQLISQMAQAAREQSEGLREVSTAADHIDKIAQQNAAMVEETTAAARSLQNETEQLSGLVESFRTAGAGAPTSVMRPRANGGPSAAPRPVAQMRTTGSGGAAKKAAAPAQEDWAEF